MADDRYLGAIPRDSLRAHLGPMPTEPITLPSSAAAARRLQTEAQLAVAEDWLAETIRRDLFDRIGHGPRHQGSFLPLGSVPAWAEEKQEELTFAVRMGEYAFEVAVRRL